MKILCTADWHIGKKIESFSRMEEQRSVLDDICKVADEQNVDAIIVAGDCFDSQTPSPEMFRMFSDILAKLSKGGLRLVLVIAGNHDNPYVLSASQSFSSQLGVLILGFPMEIPQILESHSMWTIESIAEGVIQIYFKKRKKTVRFLLSPYANAQRLKKNLGLGDTDKQVFELLSESWASKITASSNIIHILITHQFFLPERRNELIQSEDDPCEDEGERSIVGTLGAMSLSYVPDGVDYVISGHIHKYQQLFSSRFKAYYIGSPLIYSLSESGQEKKVLLLDLSKKHKEIVVTLPTKRDIKQIVCADFDELSTILAKEQENYLILKWVGDYYFSAEELQNIYAQHSYILRVESHVQDAQSVIIDQTTNIHSENIEFFFKEYFSSRYNQSLPPDDLILAFKECLSEESSQELLERKSGFLPKKIVIQGFYSYKNRVEIDFTQFYNKKFFGIFGETGSGKSALIEAMILVLFGRVERIGQLSTQSKGYYKTYYSAMNLESKDLLIEFTFEILGVQGKEEYLCRLQSTRDKKNPFDFKKNKREFFIRDRDEWIPIDHSNGELILGIKYEDFRKTIVLQQQDFLGFISEDPKANAETLKRLFGLQRFALYDQVVTRKSILDKEKAIVDLQLQKLDDISDTMLFSHIEELEAVEYEIKKGEQEYKTVSEKKFELQMLYDQVHSKNMALKEKERFDKDKVHFEQARLRYQVRDLIAEDERIDDLQRNLADIETRYPSIEATYNDLNERTVKLRQDKEQIKNLLDATRKEYDQCLKKKEICLSEKLELDTRYMQDAFILKEIEGMENILLRDEAICVQLDLSISQYEAQKKKIEDDQLRLKRSIQLNQVIDLLVSGEPCPLCGSHSHEDPFIANPQCLHDLELLEQQYQLYRKHQSERMQLEEKREQISKNIQSSLGSFSSCDDLENHVLHVSEQRERITHTLSDLTTRIEEHEKNLLLYNTEYTQCEQSLKDFHTKSLAHFDIMREITIQKSYYEDLFKQSILHRKNLLLRHSLTQDEYNLIREYPVMEFEDINNFFILSDQNQKKIDEYNINISFIEDDVAQKITQLHAEESKLSESINLLNQKKGFCQSQIERMQKELLEKKKIIVHQSELDLKLNNFQILLSLFKGEGFVKFIANKYLHRLCANANRRFSAFTRNHFAFSPPEEGRSETKIVITDRLSGGKNRDIITLSGGQRFQAAISLSLALADESGVGYKFFFVDEGFGSLDEHSLLTVLDTLYTITINENRIIGLISHVQKIKEYVDICINVTKDQLHGTHISIE